VKKYHAPKLRAEAKHVVLYRQLRVFAYLALGGFPIFAAEPVATPAPGPREELHAAQLMEAALFARQAGAEDWKKMDAIFAGLKAKYPRNVEIINGHAEFLWSIEQRQRAMETWLAAEKIDPANATVLDHLGGGYVSIGEVRKAAGYYRRAVASVPQDAAAHFAYANVLFTFRHDLLDGSHADAAAVLDEALREFSEAARLEPHDANYARAFAETFYSMPLPDWRAALAAWEHFYELTPQKDFALLNLARVHLKLGEKPEARAKLDLIQSAEYSRLKEKLTEQTGKE